MHSRTVAHFHSRPTSVAQPRTPVSGTTSDARIMARLEFRYGDMTQPRSTCPVIPSGDGRHAGTARLGRQPTTYRLICVHDSDAAYSHLTRRTSPRQVSVRRRCARRPIVAGDIVGATGSPIRRASYRLAAWVRLDRVLPPTDSPGGSSARNETGGNSNDPRRVALSARRNHASLPVAG